MAALTLTELTRRLPLGDRVIQTWRTTTGTASNSTEWAATGLTEIIGVVGFAVKGTTGVTDAVPTVTAPIAAIDTFQSAVGNTASIANAEICTIRGMVYTFVTALTLQTAPTRATWTVTFGSTDMNNGDTITVGDHVYTYATTAASIFELDVQGTENTAAANFKAAINHDVDASATTYMDAETPRSAEVVATVSSAVVTLTAIVPGTAGNITISTTASTGEIDISQTVTAVEGVVAYAGQNQILIGSDDDATLANFRDAINGAATAGTDYSSNIQANPDVYADATITGTGGGATTSTLTINARVPGTVPNAVVFTTNATGVTVSGAGTLGGSTAGVDAISSAAPEIGFNYVLNAQGTSVAAGTNLGDLGIECSQASKVVEFTVIGRP